MSGTGGGVITAAEEDHRGFHKILKKSPRMREGYQTVYEYDKNSKKSAKA